MVANPIEQVSRQLDAVRAVLRSSILPQHFPALDPLQLRLMQSVYSPQVDEDTLIERIRWGKVYGNLPDLATVLSNSTSPAPVVLPDGGTRLGLAAALCALFRTTLPADVKAKLHAPQKGDRLLVIKRISEIHRQIAALHEELADLVLATAAADGREAQRPAAPINGQANATAPQAAPAKGTAKGPALTDHQRMHAHLSRSFQGVNGSADAAAKALETAWAAVLADPSLHGKAGISVSLFGAVGTPLVKQHHGSLPKVLGMQLRKWCVHQALAAGMKPLDVPGQPSNIRVR